MGEGGGINIHIQYPMSKGGVEDKEKAARMGLAA